MDELRFAIIHTLDKATGATAADIRTRDSVLDVTKPVVRSLAEQLAKLVGKDGSAVFWGQFGTNRREGMFPTSVQPLISDCTEETFITMSKVAMKELKDKAAAQNFATGGHVCFFAYRSQGSTFLLVAMIKERGGMVLSAELEPTEIIEIDLSKLHQAARVNLDRYGEFLAPVAGDGLATEQEAEETTEKTYLCFINRRSQADVAGYFVEALGCEKGVASGRTTKAVVTAVRAFVKSVVPIREKASAARLAVIEYMQAREDGAMITLDKIAAVVRHVVGVDLEHHVDGLKGHLNSESVQIPDEFPVSAKALRVYTRIAGKSSHWQISFENGALGVQDAEIIYDAEEQSLKFTRLPQDMVNKVEEALAARAQLPVIAAG
ncbi:nucleoid-associated protein [Chitinimonas koreensis]|uniref:nucleoid-associated protein n=1 Tax=Chitinimonas koreensis TaxID=356302 RepID=UPI00146FA2FD|nr:nucleoid-associated protein [Chitinimonas koreensis]QNM96743.1 nucleoid-associated protein [Chitinimonas koreensis]